MSSMRLLLALILVIAFSLTTDLHALSLISFTTHLPVMPSTGSLQTQPR